MFFDMQDSPTVSELIVFPDFAFAPGPRYTPIKETIHVCGSTGTTSSVCGVADQPE